MLEKEFDVDHGKLKRVQVKGKEETEKLQTSGKFRHRPPNHLFLMGFSIINHPFRGYPLFMETPKSLDSLLPVDA